MNNDVTKHSSEETTNGKISKEVITKIVENYEWLEKSIASQLRLSAKHPGTTGNHRELTWKKVFERIVPKKFSIEQGVFIIDHTGEVSNEVDLAIFDEQYTPYIFQYNSLKFIPIEAVSVVIDCKSTSLDKKALTKWLESINKLQTGNKYIARMATHVMVGEGLTCKVNDEKGAEDGNQEANKSKPLSTQTATRPIKILCHTSDEEINARGSYDSLLKSEIGFDFSIQAIDNNFKITENDTIGNLEKWCLALNHHNSKLNNEKSVENIEKLKMDLSKYEIRKEGKEISLMSLTFKLNQLLMLINNPILFPHRDYVEMFNNHLNPESDKGGRK